MKNEVKKITNILFVLAVLFIAWGTLGVFDSKNRTYTGYSTDDKYTIIKIEEDSPAKIAGMELGDVLIKNGGIPVTDLKALSKRERAKIGEVREYVVERNGEELTLQITFVGLTKKYFAQNIAMYILGLLFILLGIFTNNKVRTGLSLTFAIFSVFLGFNFFNGPYIDNNVLARIVNIITVVIVFVSIAVLAQFMLKYPPESKLLNKKQKLIWLYAPASVLVLFFIAIILILPDSTSTLNQLITFAVSIIVVGYFILSLVVLIRKAVKYSPELRKESGLNLLVLGAVIGLVPIIIIQILYAIKPDTSLPGEDFYFLIFGAIPIFFSIAILKQNKIPEAG